MKLSARFGLIVPTRLLASLLLAGAVTARAAEDWAPNLTTTATWNSNATNSQESLDQIDSIALLADLLSSRSYAVGRTDALLVTAHLGAEWWPRYRGLTRGAAGGRVEWRHTFGPGPLAPTLSLEGSADAVAARETGRRGVATGVTLTARKRFDARTRGTVWHEVSWMEARYATFDRAASETALELDRDLNDTARLTLTVRFRDGDIVTYATPPRADLAALAPNQLDVDTFGRPMRAYRVDAHTWSARAAYTRALDERSALVTAYEWRTSERATLRVTNHLISVALVHQF